MAPGTRHLKVSGLLFNHVIQVTAQERGRQTPGCQSRGEAMELAELGVRSGEDILRISNRRGLADEAQVIKAE